MSYGQNAPWGLQAVRTQTDATWNGKLTTYNIASGYAFNIFNGDPVTVQNGVIRSLADVFANGLVLNADGSPSAGYNSVAGVNSNVAANVAAGYKAVANCPIIGVFDGCSYVDSLATNNGLNLFQDAGSANPGRPFWPGGTNVNASSQGMGSQGAFAYVITDPKVVYNIQVGNSGAAVGNTVNSALAAFVGNSGALNWSFTFASGSNTPVGGSDTIVQVNGYNMASSCYLDLNAAATGFIPGVPNLTANSVDSVYIDALSSNVNNIPGQPYNNVEVMLSNHLFGAFATKIA